MQPPTTDGAVPNEVDLSLVLAHGSDAPDLSDPAEPPDQAERLRQVFEARVSRRAVLRATGLAMGAAALAGAGVRPVSAAPRRAATTAAAVTGKVDVDYLRQVTEKVVSFGDTPMGWRPGGSPANEDCADWIAAEMRRVGLKAVSKLPVPIDRWVFNGATVAVAGGGPRFEGSSWGGVPGTGPDGITAEVVDVGLGRAVDYEGKDVTGRIVLVDWAFGDWWVNRHGHQATLEGAAAVIFYTGRTAAGAFYNARDDGLLGFDGTYDASWIPFVFVTRDAANQLLARVEAGPTTGTLTSLVELTRADDGGVGHNVIGKIPGRGNASELIIFTGHHDAWFRGAADDATAIAAMLGIARAVLESGYQPRHTLVFLASTNEEYGYTDAYYEWLIGCWYAVTREHTEWAEKAALTLDFELLGTGDPGERLLIRTHSELFELCQRKLTADPARTPHGTDIQNTVWANADHFTLTAAGIPGIYFNTVGIQYLTRNYHTNHDTIDKIDVGYLRQNIDVVNDIWVEYDQAELPLLDFSARAAEATSRVRFVVDQKGLTDLPGVDQAAVGALHAAVERFGDAAEELEERLDDGPIRALRPVGREMRDAAFVILSELVALDVFDQYVFPHQQLQRDATRIQLAIDALDAGEPVSALDLIRRTGLTNAGRHFAYESYAHELARHDPGFDRLQWGEQAHLSPYVDVWHEYHAIADGIAAGHTSVSDYADTRAALVAELEPVYGRLNARLISVAETFDRATAHLRRAIHHAGRPRATSRGRGRPVTPGP
jgi:Zn-dependent M28 family amino/carboxypeptidase